MQKITIATEFPHPVDSPDFLRPWGARNDDTHCPGFVEWVKETFGPRSQHMDLGCAGGGLVADMLEAGMLSIGIEGSTKPKELGRPAWIKYPERFLHADISREFAVSMNGTSLEFDVISAWEVPEHIPTERLPVFFQNVAWHMGPESLFVGTISTNTDQDYHQTVRPFDWWCRAFAENGFRMTTDLPRKACARTDAGSFAFKAHLA